MNYRKWLIEDLRDLETLRFACGQLREELETCRREIAAIRGGPKNREREEWLLDARARMDDTEANLNATERHVADMDRLLGGLPEDERAVVLGMYVRAENGAVGRLCEQLHVETAQVYRIKDRAIDRLAKMRYGVGVRGMSS